MNFEYAVLGYQASKPTRYKWSAVMEMFLEHKRSQIEFQI